MRIKMRQNKKKYLTIFIILPVGRRDKIRIRIQTVVFLTSVSHLNTSCSTHTDLCLSNLLTIKELDWVGHILTHLIYCNAVVLSWLV